MAVTLLGARCTKTQLRENLRWLLTLVRVSGSGSTVEYPASWDDVHHGALRVRREGARATRDVIPGTAKQVALDLALARLTDEPPMASTIAEAVDRLYEAHVEVRL